MKKANQHFCSAEGGRLFSIAEFVPDACGKVLRTGPFCPPPGHNLAFSLYFLSLTQEDHYMSRASKPGRCADIDSLFGLFSSPAHARSPSSLSQRA